MALVSADLCLQSKWWVSKIRIKSYLPTYLFRIFTRPSSLALLYPKKLHKDSFTNCRYLVSLHKIRSSLTLGKICLIMTIWGKTTSFWYTISLWYRIEAENCRDNSFRKRPFIWTLVGETLEISNENSLNTCALTRKVFTATYVLKPFWSNIFPFSFSYSPLFLY